jgi:hypothetical protein
MERTGAKTMLAANLAANAANNPAGPAFCVGTGRR